VIGFLRLVGIANAAVWLGAAIFYTVCAGPAVVSSDMPALLGLKYFPYFSGAVGQIVLARNSSPWLFWQTTRFPFTAEFIVSI
jgi:hypothetical protein